ACDAKAFAGNKRETRGPQIEANHKRHCPKCADSAVAHDFKLLCGCFTTKKAIGAIGKAVFMHPTAEYHQSTDRERRCYERGQAKGLGPRHHGGGQGPEQCARNRQHSDSTGKSSKRDCIATVWSERTWQASKKTETDAKVREER